MTVLIFIDSNRLGPWFIIGCSAILDHAAWQIWGPQFSCLWVFSHTRCASFRPSV